VAVSLAVVKALLADGYDMWPDETAVDYLLSPQPTASGTVDRARFEVVVNLLSLRTSRGSGSVCRCRRTTRSCRPCSTCIRDRGHGA
jgi:NADH:ubiquinone oxidoreductase subunit C